MWQVYIFPCSRNMHSILWSMYWPTLWLLHQVWNVGLQYISLGQKTDDSWTGQCKGIVLADSFNVVRNLITEHIMHLYVHSRVYSLLRRCCVLPPYHTILQLKTIKNSHGQRVWSPKNQPHTTIHPYSHSSHNSLDFNSDCLLRQLPSDIALTDDWIATMFDILLRD